TKCRRIVDNPGSAGIASSHMPRPQERNARAEDRVFNAILDAVLDHRLAPGTKLKERELAEIFGVSRGAVRGALTRLGHSLLVEWLAKGDAAAAVRRVTEHLANVERQLGREDQPEMPPTLAAVFSA